MPRVLALSVLVGLNAAACDDDDDDDDDNSSATTGGQAGASGAGRGGDTQSSGAGGTVGGEVGTGGTAGGDVGTGGAGGGEAGAGGDTGVNEPSLPQCSAPLDGSVPSRMVDLARCLFEGSEAPQRGVRPGLIDAERVAVLRGRVLDADGAPLSGVTVSVSQHPEYGDTLSRADGYFDLAVNGGGPVTVRYELAGYITAQRQRPSAWRRFSVFPDVVLLALAPEASAVDLSKNELAIVEGAAVSDASGARQEVLLLAAGTKASLLLPSGKREPLESFHVRVQEFTVGELGPLSMPADLPASSGYTYAVAYTVDEALDAGAERVEFDPPVVSYVDNFLGFPAGTAVPNGVYDPKRDAWTAEASGVVLDIIAVDGGLAEIDADGDGHGDSADTLAALGISDSEQRALAERYQPGQSLWRTLTPHFSFWDKNWGLGPPDDGTDPDGDLDGPGEPNCKKKGGSIIGCETQTLGERLPISGTPFTLAYQSERTRGRADNRQVSLKLSGASVPKSLKRIDLEISVGGQLIQKSYAPKTNLNDTFLWNGKDVYGRELQGQQLLVARIGYVYDPIYQVTDVFGYNGNGVPITGNAARTELTLWQTLERNVGTMRTEPLGFGGWALDANHVLDLAGQTLYLGNGGQLKPATTSADVITTVAGSGAKTLPDRGDGGPANLAYLDQPQAVAVAPDGALFIAEGNFVRKVAPDGTISTFAGSGASGRGTGDGGPATKAALSRPDALALGPDGTLYVASYYQVRAVSPDGTIHTVAGSGDFVPGTTNGDGGSALDAPLDPVGIALGPDGSLFIADRLHNTVRRVGPDGIISTFAGNGESVIAGPQRPIGDGSPATEVPIGSVSGVAVSSAGEVFITAAHPDAVRKVDRAGIISTVAGAEGGSLIEGAAASDVGVLYPAAPSMGLDGSVFFSTGSQVLQVQSDGKMHIVVAQNPKGPNGELGDLGPPAQAFLGSLPQSIAVRADGSLYIADTSNGRIRRIGPAFPGFAADTTVVPAPDARTVYVFDAQGRHVSTLDALSRVALLSFEYDEAGQLSRAVDQFGNATIFSRNSAGELTSITGPYAETEEVTLDAHGYLDSVTNANQETTRFSHSPDGLLQSVVGPRAASDIHTFEYDALGRLTRDTEASGSFQALSRRDGDQGAYSVALSTALGRTHTYDVNDDAGSIRRTYTDPAGIVSTLSLGSGVATHVTPSRTTTTTFGGDPRFGMQSPIAKSRVIELEGANLTQTIQQSRSVTLSDFADPLSVASFEETSSINGTTWRTTWDTAAATFTNTSPEGRQLVRTLDAHGQTKTVKLGDLTPIELGYDQRGNLASLTVGKHEASLSYDDAGRVESQRDLVGQTTSYQRDAVGRPRVITLPDDEALALSFDADGNVLSLTPPSQPEHTFDYGSGHLLASYEPPKASATTPVMATSYSYDEDDQIAAVTLPGGWTVTPSYDAASGRVTSIGAGAATTTFAYDPKTGLLARLAAGGQTLAFSYTGDLLTRTEWSGAVAGSVSQTLDAFFRPISESVGTSTVSFTYDNDGLLTSVGAEALSRDPVNGLLSGTQLGSVTDALGYDAQGALANYDASAGQSNLHTLEFNRDALGRILTRRETIAGSAHTEAYTYDPRGRLTSVTRDSAVIGSYAYDANDNRTSASDANGARAATYDAQDRQLTDGTTRFTYTPEGALLTKTTGTQVTSYDYDLFGALRSVTLPNATRIDYVLDGTHRRIGKKVNGTLSKAFLYHNALPVVSATEPPYPAGTFVVAELDAAGTIVSRFLYGSKRHVPDAMLRDGKTYRLISDERGSVRLVVDTASGAIAQQLDYDAWGNVTSDSSPGFQPFGFAGGLYDADTGLVRFGARDYDARTGRWTAKDPIRFGAGQSNLYVYVRNDPINVHDANGKNACTIGVGTSGVVDCLVGCALLDLTVAGGVACNLLCGGAFVWLGEQCEPDAPPTPPAPPPPPPPPNQCGGDQAPTPPPPLGPVCSCNGGVCDCLPVIVH